MIRRFDIFNSTSIPTWWPNLVVECSEGFRISIVKANEILANFDANIEINEHYNPNHERSVEVVFKTDIGYSAFLLKFS